MKERVLGGDSEVPGAVGVGERARPAPDLLAKGDVLPLRGGKDGEPRVLGEVGLPSPRARDRRRAVLRLFRLCTCPSLPLLRCREEDVGDFGEAGGDSPLGVTSAKTL